MANRTVVHLLPVEMSRGAQRYVREVLPLLQVPSCRHLVWFLFDPSASGRWSLPRPVEARSRRPLDPSTVIALRREIRRHGVDVVVAHGSEPMLYAAAARPRGVGLVYYRIGISGPRLARPVVRRMYRLLVRRVHLVAGVSDETLTDSIEVLAVEPGRVRLVPNGRDPSSFDQGSEEATSDETGIAMLWVGHLTEHKRPDWFIRVVRALAADGLPVRGALVGDGPMLHGIAAQAGGSVEVLGRRDDVPELMAKADIFCFTSAGENEGMPGVLIEAGLAGLPVVTTRVPGADTVVDHGRTGLVVDTDDEEAFLAAVRSLVCNRDRREALGQAARRRCLEDFTLEASASRLRAVVAEVIAEVRPRC